MNKNLSLQDNREFKILDIRQGECLAAGRTDKIFLIAFMSMEGSLQSDITVVIKNEDVLLKAVPRVNEGYDAAIFAGSFMNTRADQVLLSVSSGTGLSHHILYSFYNRTTVVLFDSEYFNMRSQYRLELLDGYQAMAINTVTGEKHLIDLQKKPKALLSGLYDGAGRLIQPGEGKVSPLSGLYPVYDDAQKRCQLLAYQRITGLYPEDTLGFMVSRLAWNGREFAVTDTYTAPSPFMSEDKR
jgi:hypothetical protein